MAIGITTKMLSCTDHKPFRIKARTSEGQAATFSRHAFDHLNGEDLHRACAMALAVEVFGLFPPELGEGVYCGLDNAEWAFKAWVKG